MAAADNGRERLGTDSGKGMTRMALRTALPRLAASTTSQAVAAARVSLPFIIWGVVSIALGLIVGFAAVIFPPTGAFGLVTIPLLVLLWAMPELQAVPEKSVRPLMFLALIAHFCVPVYYTLIVPGLPWITVRRLVIFPLIVLFALAISGSSSARARIAAILGDNRIIAVCAIGYLVMAFISVFISIEPTTSLSALVEGVLAWYVPLFVILYIVRSEEDVLILARVFCWCAIFVSCAAAVEFAMQKNLFVLILPPSLRDQIASANPAFERAFSTISIRFGEYRASSVFNVPLSLGEFEALLLPFGYFFLGYGRRVSDTVLGILVVGCCLVGLFCAGARGGWSAAIVATAAFSVLVTVRSSHSGGNSLAPAAIGVGALVGFIALIGAIEFQQRLHNAVIGGGHDWSYNDESRHEQWELGWPKIYASPIFGYGFVMGGVVDGYHAATVGSIDTFALSTLLETGVPGFVFYFGMVFVSAGRAVWLSITDASPSGALAGALGCSMLGFGFYRFALSQTESFTLVYVIIGLIMVLSHLRNLGRKPRTL
jgi:hypothetical protein